jgi:hypothetical protein
MAELEEDHAAQAVRPLVRGIGQHGLLGSLERLGVVAKP